MTMSNNSETYTNSPVGSGKRKSKRTYFGTVLFIIFLALTISLSVALVMAYLTPYISPSTYGSLTIVGIFAPILFVSVAVCLLIWLIAREWKVAAAVALVLVPGLFHISQFYNISFLRSSDVMPIDPKSMTFLTYNVRGFYNDDGKQRVDDFVKYVAKSDNFTERIKPADVVCFQEFALDAPGVEKIDSLFNEAFDGKYYTAQVNESENVVLKTYSRYEIINEGSIAGSRRGTSQWVDILRGADTIRVFNNHFYTMSITEDDSDDIADGKILSDGDRMMSIIDRVAHNSTVRLEHVDTLLQVIRSTPHRHVVVGDFNDTPMSYVYKSLTDHLTDSFSEQGAGFGYTYRPMWGWLRIDYILYSEGFEALNYKADSDVTLSDHLPVVSRFKVLDNTAK